MVHASLNKTPGDSWQVALAGDWTVATRPNLATVAAEVAAAPDLKKLSFAADALGVWDSYLLIAIERMRKACAGRPIEFDLAGLPVGVQGLLKLAGAVPERAGARRGGKPESYLVQKGKNTLAKLEEFHAALAFAGDLVLGLGRIVTGRARWRGSDVLLCMQEAGAEALPIVTLISLLVGTILAFVGSIQLKMFGAEIFVADLVGVGMALEMGALMTAIIMAGRTGASYAAQLGTMQVNEEIDALQTMGLSPFEFLVLPRVAALVLMLPLLGLYAVAMGMLGGALVGIFTLGLEPAQYVSQTVKAVRLNHLAQGLIKSGAFGVVVAFCGCLQGIRCGRSAQAVGQATTQAVVQCIIWIVVVDALLTMIFVQTGF